MGERTKLYRLDENGTWQDKGTGSATVDWLDVRRRARAAPRAAR